MSFLDNVRNKLNLVQAVPTYWPLESDSIKSNLMYRAPANKKARSAATVSASKSKKV